MGIKYINNTGVVGNKFTVGEAVIGEHAVHSGYCGLWNTEAIVTTTDQYMIISSGTDTYINGDEVFIRAGNNSTTNQVNLSTTGGLTVGGNTVLTAADEGSGSGLDADTLDGQHASAFLTSETDTLATVTGRGASTTTQLFFDAGFDSHPIMLSGTQNFDNIDRSGFYNLYNTHNSSTNSPGFHFGTMIAIGNDKGSSGFGLQIAHERTGAGMYVRGMNDTASAWSDWDEIWTSGTHGAGSGLDADTVDGIEGASFLRSDEADTAGGTTMYIFNKPSTTSYQTALRVGSSGGGLYLTSDDAIIGKGAYYNNGWIATAASGSAINFSTSEPKIFSFSGATVGSAVTMSSAYNIFHQGNDGSGSGLDADTVDGVEADSLQRITYQETHNANDYDASSGTWSTGENSSWGTSYKIGDAYAYNDGTGMVKYNVPSGYKTAYIAHMKWSTGGHFDVYAEDSSGNLILRGRFSSHQDIENSNHSGNHDGQTVIKISGLGGMSSLRIQNRSGRIHLQGIGWTKEEFAETTDWGTNWNTILNFPGTIWHSNNDGSGSTLDADTVDGIQGASFLRSDAADSASGDLTFSGRITFTGNNNDFPSHYYHRYYTGTQNYIHLYPYNTTSGGASVTDIRAWNGSSADAFIITGGSNNMTWRGHKIWNAGNDGSGSGLDADTLDGVEGAGYFKTGRTLTSINTISNGGDRYDPSTNNPTNQHYAVLTYGNGGNVTGQLATHFQTGATYNRAYNSSWSAWSRMFDDDYHPNADAWTTARTITLGGDLTGSVSIDGSANVTLSAQVVNNSHTHDDRYYTETESDAKYLLNTTDTLTGDLTVTGNLTIGEDGTTPLLDMMFVDSVSGAGWDTRIQMGKSDDFAAGTGVFPTFVPAGSYGVQFQANSDGVFFGMEEYTTGHYRPIIQWGDDNADTPFRIKHENGSEFTVSYNGIATATTRLSAPTLYSTVATGTAPLTVTSTTLVSNLNADLLDGQHGSYFLNTSSTSQTKTGVLTLQSSDDYQLVVQGTDTWAGIGFDDSNSGTSYIWYHGGNQTFAIGGGGSNVSGKKLHVDGGMTVGSGYDATSTATDGLSVQGITRAVGNLEIGADTVPHRTGVITVNGDADTYYPVTWYGAGQSQAYFKKIQIYRNYNETAPNTWNTSTHKGGLLFDLEANWGGWGGVAYDIKINEFHETYSSMVAKISHFANSRGFAIWLRGGGAVYHFDTVGCSSDPAVQLSAYDPGGNSTGVSSTTSLDQSTITNRLYFRGGTLYSQNSQVLTVANEGSGNGIDADTLDGIQGVSLLRSDSQDAYTPKRIDFGGSSNWDAVGFTNMTNLHVQGHNQFWFGAGNGTWFTGTANTKSSTAGLAGDATAAHDLLISTMHSTSTYDRGITFAVDSGGAGNAGWRLGKWHSSNSQASSKLTVDGGLHVRGGDMANFDYYADDYSTYWDNQAGGAYWTGDTGWIDPSITAGNAIQIQAGNVATNSNNPALQFHQYGYGGIQMRYDGPNDYFYIESTGSDRYDWLRNKTDHGYIDIGPANTSWAHIYTDRPGFYFNKTTFSLLGNQVWHAGNDGSGSGLDADLLDGLHSSSFLRSDTHNSLYRVTAGDGNRIRFWDSDSYAIWMSAATNGTWGGRVPGETTSDYNMYFRMTSGTNRGFVFQNSTTEVAGIDGAGNIRAIADVIAYSSSDKTFKDELSVIENPLDKIKNINGYNFTWNDKQTTYESGKKDIGVVAQEIEKVLPEIVNTREDGSKAVKYDKIVALLIEGIKELKDEVEELKKKCNDCTK